MAMRPNADGSDDFAEWVSVRGPGLLRLAYLLTGNAVEAEDLVQEVLARALPRWSSIATVEHPDTYVRRMVVHEHTSWWRRFRRRETPVAEPTGLARAEAAGIPAEELERLWRAFCALPDRQRAAVVLRYHEQLEYAEIAELTGVREVTVRSRVSRGMAVLRRTLEEEV